MGYVPRWALAGVAIGRVDRAATTRRVRAQLDELDRTATRSTQRTGTSSPRQGERTSLEVRWSEPWLLGLRPWQERALRAWFEARGRGIVEAVTGTGKTHLGLELALRMAAQGGSTTILVPTVVLQDQWARNLAEHAPQLTTARIGGGSQGSWQQADVTIAVAASAARRDIVPRGRPSLVVADEAHRYASKAWALSLRDSYHYRLGLTATLERDADSGVADVLLPYFHSKVFHYDYLQAVPEGVVAPFTLAMLPVDLTSEEHQEYERHSTTLGRAVAVLRAAGVIRDDEDHAMVRITRAAAGPAGYVRDAARDYQQAARQRRLVLARCRAKITALGRLAGIVAESRGTVVFAQAIETAELAAQTLRQAGAPASAIHSGMDMDERRANLDALRDQSIAALCAPKILDEGVDIPNIDLGVVLAASSTRRQMIQRMGRVIRLKPDGSHARFVVVYASHTVEDPGKGAHMSFLDVRSVAVRETTCRRGWTAADVVEALALPPGFGAPVTPARSSSPTTTAAASARSSRPERATVIGELQPQPNIPNTLHKTIGWARGIALEALADAYLASEDLSATTQVTARLREALENAAHLRWCDHTVRDCVVNGALVIDEQAGRSLKALGVARAKRATLVIRVDASDYRPAAVALSGQAAAGITTLWIRWAGRPSVPPPGVTVIDLTSN
nr:DEAD/DEAH box helicase [Nocardioides agariphilus]